MYEPLNLGTHISVNKQLKQDYSGSQDEKTGMREDIGIITYNRNDCMQRYEGNFVWNNMHGDGEYLWQPLQYKYEGQFYMNKKEGYGRFSYPCGAYFEGLYGNDQRFGPGVYTDAAGYQDVGIWLASKLIRLSRVFESDHIIPRLAIRDEDKIQILRYRQVIRLQEEEMQHVAENLLKSLTHRRNYDKSVLVRAEELYNHLCRDDRATSFNRPRYNKSFFSKEIYQLTMDVLMTKEEIQQKIELEKSQKDTKYVADISQQHVSVEIFENKTELDGELDFYGIKQIEPNSMHNSLLSGNYEEQWNIFQSSTIMIPQAFPDNSKSNPSGGENPQDLGETENSEKEFDDFGRKKIKGMQPTKKVNVTHLMAWNNSSILIDVLKHVFKHRNSENKLTFNISKVLAGRRGTFRQEGAHEIAALELLEACSNGFHNVIFKLVSSQNLDIDVADCRGNSGLLLAAVRDRVEVIDTLLNLGANVDSINDECLTPLSMCMLRLLELIYDVTDWSKAFLPRTIIAESIINDDPIVFKNFKQWRGRVSYESLVQQIPKQMDWNLLPKEIESKFKLKDFSTVDKPLIGRDAMDVKLDIIPNQFINGRAQAQRGANRKLEQHPDSQNNCNIDSSTNQNKIELQKYIFNMSPIIAPSNSWKKYKNDKIKSKKNKVEVETTADEQPKDKYTSSKSKKFLGDSKEIQDIDSSEVSVKKKKIRATISKLLQRGADPNFAQVPHPVIIMAIYTKMPALVSELLEHGADPNTTSAKIEHSLTPLMILAVLQPAYEHAFMAKALLKAKADPSRRADAKYRYWHLPDFAILNLISIYLKSDLKEHLNSNRLSEFIDNSEGITALHLLAIRPDMDTDVNGYLGELIKVICQHRHNKRSDLYQGHSPLSLAIFEGNLIAVKALLETAYVNINEQLGADLGSTMLMLQSCMLQELLPPDLLHAILKLLLGYGGCPFASATVLGNDYNQIEYGRKELSKMSNLTKKEVKVIQMIKKNKLNQSKISKPLNTRSFTKSTIFIENIAKEKLIQRIKANFVRDLMDSPTMLLPPEKQSHLLKEPIFKNALSWMSGEDVATVMRTMNYNRGNMRKLVRLFVTACILPHQRTTSEIDTIIQSETERIINKVQPLIDSEKQKVTTGNPEVDTHDGKGKTNKFQGILVHQPKSDLEENRFKVCFECLTVHGKVLILCPECKQVYFCSQECNLRCAAQEANLHQCSVFYQREWIRLEKIAITVGLDAINYMLQRFKNPEIYLDLESRTGLYNESRGKTSLKNQDDVSINEPKFKVLGSAAHKKHGMDELVNENGNQHEYEDNDIHVMNGKQQKKNGRFQAEANNNNTKSKTQQERAPLFHRKNKMASANDMKKNKKNTDHSFDNKEDLDRNIKSKNINKRGNKFDTNSDVKNVSDSRKLKKGIKTSQDYDSDKDEKAAHYDIKWKDVEKNRYRHNNGADGNDRNKIMLKNNKEDHMKENVSNDIKFKKEKKKDRKLGDQETVNKSKLKSKDHWRNQKDVERSNDFHKNEEDNIRNDDLQGNPNAISNKREWEEKINKREREKRIKTSMEKCKSNRCYAETNVPEKYLHWLLKVSRSAGEHLDIDMLLLPYVIFAQGDTYFRILPTNQYPKHSENYSLI